MQATAPPSSLCRSGMAAAECKICIGYKKYVSPNPNVPGNWYTRHIVGLNVKEDMNKKVDLIKD